MAETGVTVPTSGRGEVFQRAFLKGYGALFFAPSPIAGSLFLLGTFAASATAGVAVLLGLFVSTWVAVLLKRSRIEVEHGIYGFNGALIAFAFTSLQLPQDVLYLSVLPAAALTTRITAWFLDDSFARRLALPPLSSPSLLVAFPATVAFAHWGGFEPWPSTMMGSSLFGFDQWFDPSFHSAGMRQAMVGLGDSWAVVLLFGAGLLVHSWRLTLGVLAGLLCGSAVGWLFLGWYGAFDFNFVVVTATPVFVAISMVFTGGGWRGLLWALAAVFLSFVVWFASGLYLADLNLPFYTLPFWSVTTAMLFVLRIAPKQAFALLPQLIPLHEVSTPENAIRWQSDRDFGWRYWRSLKDGHDGPWDARAGKADVRRARDLIRKSRKIVFLTGAGISTESGIPDYRTGAIAWKKYDTKHFRWERFLESEESRVAYWKMSQDFYLVLRTAECNDGHRAIAALHEQGKLLSVVTQNVDCLHQQAGVPADKVIELHGNEHRVSCLSCSFHTSRDEVYRWVLNGADAPYCPECQGILKPDSVAFDQPMPEIESRQSLEAIEQCDLLIIAGTSLAVQPAATLPLIALRAGIPVIVVNLQVTDYDAFAKAAVYGKCGQVLPDLV
jgi:NAD-dependent deacetylase